MSDGTYEPFGSKTMRDWVLGIGEFSEENLAKSRQEAADRMVAKVMAAMQKRVAEAFLQVTNHDAEPAAIAEPDRSTGQGTGNTPEPVAWAVVYPNGAEAIIAWRKADAEDLATASDRIVPLYRQPQPSLTQEERSALQAVVSGSDVLKWQEIEAVVRGLLERTK
jgi:hypothetical protein